MMNPNDVHHALKTHDDRVQEALRRAAMNHQSDQAGPAPMYRQMIARMGDALVGVGTRLQKADDRRAPAPLNTAGNV